MVPGACMMFVLIAAGAVVLLAAGPIAAEPVTFERHVIDPDPPRNPWYKLVGDVTGDGRPEIVVAGQHGPVVMYHGDAWRKLTIADRPHDGGVHGAIADVNGNGRNDIVMGSVVWLENPGFSDGRFNGPWTVHRIASEAVHDVLVGDLTGNGLLDVVGRDQSAFSGSGDAVHIFYQREPDQWQQQTLPAHDGEGLALADVNGDGQLDIVIDKVWFENAGGAWHRHVYAPRWDHGHAKVALGDISGNGRLDIVLTPAELRGQRYRISWFAAPETDRTRPWPEHVIVDDIEAVIHSLALADFNGDGRLDVAYAHMHQGAAPNEVVVMYNRGGGEVWHKQVIDTAGSHDIVATDLTGNGRVDLLGANHAGEAPLVLWRNRGAGER